MVAKQEASIRDKHEDTGQWFLKEDQFVRWMVDKGSFLWCTGVRGAGLTFLASIAIQHLQQLLDDQKSAPFMLYHDYNEPCLQSVDKLVANFLKQGMLAGWSRGGQDSESELLHRSHYNRKPDKLERSSLGDEEKKRSEATKAKLSFSFLCFVILRTTPSRQQVGKQ